MNWNYIPLRDLIIISKGKKHELSADSSGRRFIQIDDLRNNNDIKFTNDKFGIMVQEDDLVIAWDGANAGTVGYGLEGVIGSTLARIRLNKTDLFASYLGQFLKSKFRDIRNNCTGATIPHISKQYLMKLIVPLPPLETQKQIAAILEKADNLRKQCKQVEKEFNALAQSMFFEMFGDPVTNPKGWKIVNLEEILESSLQNGAYYPREQYSKDGTEMVHMGDAFYDIIQRGNLKRVSASESDLKKYSLFHTDLLIARRSLTYEGAVKPCRISKSLEPLIFESSFIRIRPNLEKILTEYLYSYLNNHEVKKNYILKFVTGATISGINQKNLHAIRVLLPPIELQRNYTAAFLKIEMQQLINKKIEIENEYLFSSLLQKAFTGELNLKSVSAHEKSEVYHHHV